MRNIGTSLVPLAGLSGGLLMAALAAISCGNSDQPPANYAPPPAPPSAGQPPTQAPGGTAPTPVLAASPAAAGAPLSTPNSFALPCTVDANCLTHRCNVPAGKCAWPCQTDNDCLPGNACITPTCLPKLQ